MKASLMFIPILLLFVMNLSHSQDTNSKRIVEVIFDTVDYYQYIPNDALSGEYDAIIIRHEFDLTKVDTKTSIDISWQSTYIDGGYKLVITPAQVYLRSVHDNPNPNYLYWITEINKKQFESIKSFLKTYDKKTFVDYTNDCSFRQSYSFEKYIKEKYEKDDWSNKCYDNLTKLTKILNKALPKDDKIKLPDKKSFHQIRKLRIYSSKNSD